MRRSVTAQEAPAEQALYDEVVAYIRELEQDTYEIVPLFELLGKVKAFLEKHCAVG